MKNYYLTTTLLAILFASNALSQAFVHPGGLHTQADLDRMKTRVAEESHPWIDGWNALITDPLAQSTYTAAPLANMGGSRQRASKDAHAAYLNAIRGYISSDMEYIDAAIRICNAWSSSVNQVPTGTDIPGLSGIPIAEFAMVGEILRIYSPERWSTDDLNRFKNMMINYLYPVCHNFLVNHNGRCVDYYWANWDACNIMALVGIGVLCDNQEIFDEGVNYFKNGDGTGSIKNAVSYLHPGNLGQWQETGRDQSHALLGVGFLGTVCQIAWNQGIDLFGYDNNRLLAGAEYVAQYNLWKDVPYVLYNSCQQVNNKWPAINARGVFHDRPVYEMIYNHYVVRQGLSAPNTQLAAELMRPEYGSNDHFGYGSLTFTLQPSSFPVYPVPLAPTGLIATPGTGKVFLKWTPSANNTAWGYVIRRATDIAGPYETISSGEKYTAAIYTDNDVTNGITYYYKVAGVNYAGTGDYSTETSATPAETGNLPSGWNVTKIGQAAEVSAGYADVSGGTFILSGTGTNIGNTADDVTFAYTIAKGDNSIVACINGISGSLLKTGLMIRETLAPGSKTVTMTLGDAGWRFARMGQRTATNGTMSFTLGNAYTWQPAWFKLERTENTLTAYESQDGATWFIVGTSNISLPENYYIGFVVSSGSETSTNTTTFDNVILGEPTFNGELILHYPFNNSLDDISGNDYHAACPDPEYLTGKNKEAFAFNGDDYVEFPNTMFGSINDMTLGMWLYPNAEGEYEIFNTGSSNSGMFLKVDFNTNTLNFSIKNGIIVQEIKAEVELSLINKWNYLAIVLDKDTGILYLNGQEVGRQESITLDPSDLNLTIKSHLGISQDQNVYFDGLIDDFRIYNTPLNPYYIGDLSGAPVGTTPYIKTNGIINSKVGEEFQLVIEADYFPTNYMVTGMPEGLLLDTSSGVISGITQEPGIYNAEIIAENPYGTTSSEVTFMILSNSNEGLIAHYRQDLNTLDASENKFHAELMDGNSYTPAKNSFGIEFDGVDDYALLPTGIVNTLSDFTIATWVKVTNPEAEWARIFDFGSGTNTYMFLTPHSGDNTFRFGVKNGGSEQIVETSDPLPGNIWKHVAVTLSDNYCKLYINGVEVASNSSFAFKPSDLGITSQNYLGKSQWDDPYLQGIMDDFRIYARALSTQEIIELYAINEGVSTGVYRITAKHSGKVLGVQGNVEANAGLVQYEDADNCDCKLWQVIQIEGSKYAFKSYNSDYFLQSISGTSGDGATVQMQTGVADAQNQRFVISLTTPDYYSIYSEDLHMALTVQDSSFNNEAIIHQKEYNHGANQQWNFTGTTNNISLTDVYPKLIICPNPVSDFLNIYSEDNKEGIMTITDSSGKVFLSGKYLTNEPINVHELSPGLYILTFQSDTFKSHVSFIKQ